MEKGACPGRTAEVEKTRGCCFPRDSAESQSHDGARAQQESQDSIPARISWGQREEMSLRGTNPIPEPSLAPFYSFRAFPNLILMEKGIPPQPGQARSREKPGSKGPEPKQGMENLGAASKGKAELYRIMDRFGLKGSPSSIWGPKAATSSGRRTGNKAKRPGRRRKKVKGKDGRAGDGSRREGFARSPLLKLAARVPGTPEY